MAHDSLSPRDYQRFRQFLYDRCGIDLGPSRRAMLEARLSKRLKSLGLNRFADYSRDLFAGALGEEEWTRLIDVVTTNKTDFYREPRHFEYLASHVLPEFGREGRDSLLVWSAGCSTGEEPYTLAMLLASHAERSRGPRFHLLATDISTRVLEAARRAVYPEEAIAPLPVAWRRSYFLRSRDRSNPRVRIAPEVRSLVEFRRLNLMEEEFALPAGADVLFCRNVIIYFDRPTQERLLERFCRVLAPGGYLFLGHSETIGSGGLPLVTAAPTVYRRVQ